VGNCAKNAPKNIARNRKIDQILERYRNPEGPENPSFTKEIVCFLRLVFFLSNLHTVEVTGSNPVSPAGLM
jgi:hypothetical protein